MIELKNITISESNVIILENINLTFQTGKIIGIISFNPKETDYLNKIIAGHLIPDRGNIFINNKKYDKYHPEGFKKSPISYAFGYEQLLQHMSIIDNFVIGSTYNNFKYKFYSKKKVKRSIDPLLETFKFDNNLNLDVKYLSLEDKYKISIILTLLKDTPYYFFYRVTDFLSIDIYNIFIEKLKELKSNNKTILFYPDTPNKLFDICDEVVIIRNGKVAKHSEISKINIDEVYNIMNNTQYNINQSINNKFMQFRINILSITEFVKRTIKLFSNFCHIDNCIIIYKDVDKKFKLCASNVVNDFVKNDINDIIKIIDENKTEVELFGKEWDIKKFVTDKDRVAIIIFIKNDDEFNKITFDNIINDFMKSYNDIYRKKINELHENQKHIDDAQQEKEMDIAKNIQMSLLPDKPDFNNYDISSIMIAADSVGGDFYDYVKMNDDLWIAIGDVSGHGLKAGLIMMMVETAFNTILLSRHDITPRQLFIEINHMFMLNVKNRLQEDNFMTSTFICLKQDGNLIYAGAHLDFFLYRAETKTIQIIKTNGLWLGLLEDVDSLVSDNNIFLNIGDILLLYTDGVTETKNSDRVLFDNKGLLRSFEKHINNDSETIRNRIISDLTEFSTIQNDDITLIVIKKVSYWKEETDFIANSPSNYL